MLLAIALCADTLAVSAAVGLQGSIRFKEALRMATVFALFQGGFPLIGALSGSAFETLVASIDHWIAFALLAVVGGKMIADAMRQNQDNKSMDVKKLSVVVLLAIATSIDAFVVGIGFGLRGTVGQNLSTCAVIGAATFIAALIGTFLGLRKLPIPKRFMGIAAGLVLIGLGLNTLIDHLNP